MTLQEIVDAYVAKVAEYDAARATYEAVREDLATKRTILYGLEDGVEQARKRLMNISSTPPPSS
jgi:hypothetical protein